MRHTPQVEMEGRMALTASPAAPPKTGNLPGRNPQCLAISDPQPASRRRLAARSAISLTGLRAAKRSPGARQPRAGGCYAFRYRRAPPSPVHAFGNPGRSRLPRTVPRPCGIASGVHRGVISVLVRPFCAESPRHATGGNLAEKRFHELRLRTQLGSVVRLLTRHAATC